MPLPNFLVIGAAKSGTTSLWEYLRQHPQIFMSRMKEPAYFSFADRAPDFQGPGDLEFNVVTDFTRYQGLFEGSLGYRAIGEASTQYISGGEAVAERIDKTLPDVRILAMLRHPAERAYAHYNHWVRRGVETAPSLRAAIELERQRRAQNYSFWWLYRDQGFYARQLKPYYDRFGRARVRVVLYDDLFKRPEALLREVLEFLEVDPEQRLDVSQRHNVGYVPKSRMLHRMLVRRNPIKALAKKLLPTPIRRWATSRLLRQNSERPLKLDPQLRAELIAGYREDIQALSELTGRDFSRWLAG